MKIKKNRIPSQYESVRKIWDETRKGYGSTEYQTKVTIYRNPENGILYLYYEEWTYDFQFAAGSIPGNRFYFEISEEQCKLSDKKLYEMCILKIKELH